MQRTAKQQQPKLHIDPRRQQVAKQYTGTLFIPTQEKFQLIDITDKVNEALDEFKTQTGLVVIATTHTTSSIVVNEGEPCLFEDIQSYLERLAPVEAGYKHDQLEHRPACPPDEPLNADAHLKALLLPTSATLLYDHGKVSLGKWQKVIFAEFDGPCPRDNKPDPRKVYIRAQGN